MLSFYDIVIAGGGPAGLGAAFHLAGQGQKVLILESGQIGQTHKSWVTWRDLLREYRLEEAILCPFDKLTFRSFLGAEYSLTGEHAASVDESRVLKLLAEQATAAGADFRENEAFINYRYQDESIIIRSSKGEYRGRFFIDATGASSNVIQGLAGHIPSRQYMGCLTQRIRLTNPIDPRKCLIYDAFFPGPHYFWVVPLSAHEVMAGVFAFHALDAVSRPLMLNALRRYQAALGLAGVASETREGNIPLSPPLRVHGSRILFLGDAFSAPLPSSGFGFSRCLEEGKVAAEYIAQVLAGELQEEQLASRIEARRFPGYDLHYIISNMLAGMNDIMLNKAIANMERVGVDYLYDFLRGKDFSIQFSLRSLKYIYSIYTLAEIQRMALRQNYKDIILRLNKIYPQVSLKILKEEMGKLVHG